MSTLVSFIYIIMFFRTHTYLNILHCPCGNFSLLNFSSYKYYFHQEDASMAIQDDADLMANLQMNRSKPDNSLSTHHEHIIEPCTQKI